MHGHLNGQTVYQLTSQWWIHNDSFTNVPEQCWPPTSNRLLSTRMWPAYHNPEPKRWVSQDGKFDTPVANVSCFLIKAHTYWESRMWENGIQFGNCWMAIRDNNCTVRPSTSGTEENSVGIQILILENWQSLFKIYWLYWCLQLELFTCPCSITSTSERNFGKRFEDSASYQTN